MRIALHSPSQFSRLLNYLSRAPLSRFLMRLLFRRHYGNTVQEIFGIRFESPFGLACGYDENGEFYDTLADFGSGFVEIGPITIREKDGKGVEEAVSRLRENKAKTRLIAKITKNESTLTDNAAQDFARSMALLYDFVDMFVIDCQSGGVTEDIESLSEVIDRMLETRRYYDVKRPVFVNITKGTARSEVDDIIAYTMRSGLDGVVVKDTAWVEYIYRKTSGNLVIIASGEGVGTAEMAYRLLCEGASLVEFDQAFLRRGPVIFREANQLLHTLRKDTKHDD